MDREFRIKRLYFRSKHRGSKETDLILGAYAEAHLATMSESELNEYEAFLEEIDNDIWDWVTGKSEPKNNIYKTLIATLRGHYAL